ncbi:MAG: Lrp/AsnC family transcriptional regulator [Chloroflexi bacterium]|nr:MAG: Lrp/AsnC family transcriptional regulator [Chloroflexota bacterium]TME18019.1 MAG: Lrp/AsnC family transcriptional regulator [Chloroflexota bacterium]
MGAPARRTRGRCGPGRSPLSLPRRARRARRAAAERRQRSGRGDDPGVKVSLNPAAIRRGDFDMKAYVLINASPGHALDVAQALQGVQGITAADAITGEYDVIAVCEAKDVASIGNLIVEQVQKVEGVFKTVTCLAMR